MNISSFRTGDVRAALAEFSSITTTPETGQRILPLPKTWAAHFCQPSCRSPKSGGTSHDANWLPEFWLKSAGSAPVARIIPNIRATTASTIPTTVAGTHFHAPIRDRRNVSHCPRPITPPAVIGTIKKDRLGDERIKLRGIWLTSVNANAHPSVQLTVVIMNHSNLEKRLG